MIAAISIIFIVLFDRIIHADEMTDKIQEAAYIQSGLKSEVDLISKWAETWAVTNIVSKSQVVQVGLGAYWIYHNQCVKYRFHGNELDIYADHVDFSFPF